MDGMQFCPECGAAQTPEATCQDCFHRMLAWEIENPGLGEVHHLMVLSYYLQHPSLYSPQGLEGAKQLLVDFLERGLTPSEVRQRDRAAMNSGSRKFKITRTAASHGSYRYRVHWTMTTADVVASGADRYCENVRAWAHSVLESLKTSMNLKT